MDFIGQRLRSRLTQALLVCFTPLSLLALNVWIVWRLFGVEYTASFGSIEGAFIGIARYISRHWGAFSWWPLWHCGMPYSNTYVPLLHIVVAAFASLTHFSAARSYHFIVGVSYACGPVAVYFLAYRFSGCRRTGFLSGLAYSLLSPSALLFPEFARDIGGLWYARRLQVMTAYGEGPHVTAMTLLPLALLALQVLLDSRAPRAFVLASIVIALAFMTNVPGTMALGLATYCWIVAQPGDRIAAAIKLAAGAAVFAYCLACFALPPSSIGTVLFNTGRMHSGFSNSLSRAPYALPLALAVAAALGWLLNRIAVPLLVRFSLLYGGLLYMLVFTARHQQVFELLPQVGRLHLELEIACCCLLGWLLSKLYSVLPRWLSPIAVVILLAPVGLQIAHYRHAARQDIVAVDPTVRSEYSSAMWLDRQEHGRVYVMGSTSFWFNAFTDTPQMIGCCDQSQSMPLLERLPYFVDAGVSAEETRLAVQWLQAFAVQAIVVNGPDSTDEYKDIAKPERFEPLLPLLHRERGDNIYAIPQVTRSLAHLITAAEAVPARPPDTLGASDIQAFVAAIEDPKRAQVAFHWQDARTVRMGAHFTEQDRLQVQIPYFAGWKAFAGGRRVEIAQDGLGFMLIQPGCQGDCEVSLVWNGTPDSWPASVLSGLAVAVAAFLLIANRPPGFLRAKA